MAAAQTEEVHVKALYIYPVKSCRGIQVPQAFITPTGFKWDRQWLVVNSQGRFQTQRQISKMALIEVTMPPEALDCNWGALPPDAALCINAPGMEPLYIPLVPRVPLKEIENVTVWGWTGPALSEGVDADRWFSEFLGKPLHFVRYNNATILTDPRYAEGYQISFTDGYPFLLISQASLDALNEKLPVNLPINRFRPNIFVEGCKPFAEDTWATFTIGKSTFHGVKIRGRCKITTTDQRTAEVGTEPLQTLRTFRAGPLLASNIRNMRSDVFFGQNVVCEDPGMTINGVLPAIHVNDVVKAKQIISIEELMST
ncbi:hypothetical protein KC19_1G217200 [Ceratodon purpureus]|nr:hypothetical protein KC19_1G217200 [Ceratodon purpureus]